jgi:hypothetical protein
MGNATDRLTAPTVRELFTALVECREATCAAMRVIADLDLGTQIGWPAETRVERFVEEVHALGITDGFGQRIDDLIARQRAIDAVGQPSHDPT